MRARWTAALTATLTVAFATIGGGAWATDPVELGAGYVVDQAGVLSSGESADAEARLEQLKSETGLDLYVAYVDDFSNPDDNADWANTTAELNDLGVSQYLLAVAVDGRSYYLSADSEGPITAPQAHGRRRRCAGCRAGAARGARAARGLCARRDRRRDQDQCPGTGVRQRPVRRGRHGRIRSGARHRQAEPR